MEVETSINEILRSVDLVNCTMKEMCERVGISIIMSPKSVGAIEYRMLQEKVL